MGKLSRIASAIQRTGKSKDASFAIAQSVVQKGKGKKKGGYKKKKK